jgi:alpha-glucosidase
MGYPVGPQYADCSNIDNAHRLQGHLMLIHGEMDDNVPPESTLRLVDALVKADKDFELVFIPGGGHGAGRAGNYHRRRMLDFFMRHLMGEGTPNRNTSSTTTTSSSQTAIVQKPLPGPFSESNSNQETKATGEHSARLSSFSNAVTDGTDENNSDPKVIVPPESFFEMVREPDREAARQFYKKYIDVGGIPVVSADVVADEALQRTYTIVTHMLAGRPDVVQAMIENQMYLIIIGKDQVYTDMPEYRNNPNPAYQNERVRGTGGRPTSFGEENLLGWPVDRYDDESIAVHEFCHTIDDAMRSIDPAWSERRNTVYRDAIAKGLWKDTYAASNPGEYWAEIAQAYFDSQRVNNWNHGPIGTREQLREYDPAGYELVRSTFRLGPNQDWRYQWPVQLPNVTAPPANMKIDPYYTKFTMAREFTVLGREASDEAMLKANDTIRKMFAYRHDILKALIAENVRLVVLGRNESLADLPEFAATSSGVDLLARVLEYSLATKILVVPEENVLGEPRDPLVGHDQVIRVFANAMYEMCGKRPVDPNWEKRGRAVQQYELRVKRLDVNFDETLKELHTAAINAGKWRGTSATHDHVSYWESGVLAYFNAAGHDHAPHDASHPITTRELLRDYDPGLFSLVHETMAYEGQVDWRR